MYKLLIYMLLAVFSMLLLALQSDQEIAINTLFQAKHGLNRAVHAAAQEIDQGKLLEGSFSLDPVQAEITAMLYLRNNLSLDDQNKPLPGTFLHAEVEVLVFQVFNDDMTFPYTYNNAAYEYSTTLQRPGVVMIIRVEYPRIYSVVGPITWDIKGAGELVY